MNAHGSSPNSQSQDYQISIDEAAEAFLIGFANEEIIACKTRNALVALVQRKDPEAAKRLAGMENSFPIKQAKSNASSINGKRTSRTKIEIQRIILLSRRPRIQEVQEGVPMHPDFCPVGSLIELPQGSNEERKRAIVQSYFKNHDTLCVTLKGEGTTEITRGKRSLTKSSIGFGRVKVLRKGPAR